MFICDWCGKPGEIIGTSYGHIVVCKCTECHHEWEDVVEEVVVENSQEDISYGTHK